MCNVYFLLVLLTVTVCFNRVRRARVDAAGPTFTQIVGAGTMNKKPIASVGVKKILDRKIRNGTYSRPIGGEQKVRKVFFFSPISRLNLVLVDTLLHAKLLGPVFMNVL